MSESVQMVGFAASLWRYPVKSMMGEELNSTAIAGGSVLGDRVYALVDSALKREVILSHATLSTPSLEEFWPEVEGITYNNVVTDEAMPANTFFDLAPIHILTTSTLEQLRESYPEGRFETQRFRPNIVIDTTGAGKGFVENEWIGHTLAIGDEVRLRITASCPRCVMTTLPQGDLPRDLGILRTAAKYNNANVGVYAIMLQGGTIRRGDAVRLEHEK